mmetsp:Transcript_54344/g.129494  ORF Transcript_54344/g.129494 Transcript_54344/m.129494 type:complete len:543 (-) Transcript_54344:133-1761(-)
MAVVLKIKADGQVRRTRIEPSLSYQELCKTVADLCPEHADRCVMKYPDDEGDLCTLTPATFDDFMHIMSMSDKTPKIYRIELTTPPPQAGGPQAAQERKSGGTEHFNPFSSAANLPSDAPRFMAEVVFALQSLFAEKKKCKKSQKASKSADAATDSPAPSNRCGSTDASTATHTAASTETQATSRSEKTVEVSTSTHAAASTETQCARKAVPVEVGTATHAAASTETQTGRPSCAVEASTSTHAAAGTQAQAARKAVPVAVGTSTHAAVSTETEMKVCMPLDPEDEEPGVPETFEFMEQAEGEMVVVQSPDGEFHLVQASDLQAALTPPEPKKAAETEITDAKKSPSESKPCPSGCGFEVTWHETHCCVACKKNPGTHGGKCEKKACAKTPAAPVAPVEEVEVQVQEDDAEEEMVAVRAPDGQIHLVQLSELKAAQAQAAESEQKQLQPLPEAKPCAGNCGFQVTWHATHCCGACKKKAGTHGPKCEGKCMPPPEPAPAPEAEEIPAPEDAEMVAVQMPDGEVHLVQLSDLQACMEVQGVTG